MRCIKGGHACCYDIPQANIFSIAPATDKTLAKSSDSLNSHFHPTSTSNDHDHSTSFHLRKVQPHFGFGDEEESRSLNHWLLRTSPMLSHYGPMGDFFTIVVPQLAQTSPAIRHMLVSLSMTHEKFMNGVAYASTKSQARALSHYVSAITEIRTNPPSQSHVLAAALLAWTMEMMQNNYPAALVHLKASQSLLRQCESTKRLDKPDANLIHVSLRPTAMLAQGLTAIVLRKGLPTRQMEPEYHNHLENPFAGPPFASIADARQEICVYIEKIASLSHSRPDDDAALKDMEIARSPAGSRNRAVASVRRLGPPV
ncbi:hypothetical protein EDD37DRAFT_693921 [Exophiala viscosa]|uniref:uncharacterized protein n=1 Tax=Exophiala viscosa TaxID=2486360 RepID=UPI0021911011|nr:hypothetical protein EDD37DRAFT_693921 [Exophiala viscosa]